MRQIADTSESPTTLYRHFDTDGRLLYVGISLNAIARLAGHRDLSSWFLDIRRVDFEVFENREAARKAEQRAIRREKPLHNRQRYGAGLDGVERLVPGLRRPLVFMEPPEDTEIILSRLQAIDEERRVKFPDVCRILGLARAAALRLLRMPKYVMCPLEVYEMRELAHRVIAGTAIVDPPSWELGNLSTSPDWTIRMHGPKSPLYARAVAVAEGRFRDAAWMYPSPTPNRTEA